jgi:GAF domain-containing protein
VRYAIQLMARMFTKLKQNTLQVDSSAAGYPCFEVNDLAADPRFAGLPIVDGTTASYRFYAGTPITTSHGINIGSIFILDNQPRPNGLTFEQRKCMHSLSEIHKLP